jgi:AraC family transcriptional regulator of adaptative response/methylated-DNA-[protein]-cysteine methyltransferase
MIDAVARPTLRKPEVFSTAMPTSDYRRVEAAIRYLEEHAERQPDLAELAVHVGLSPAHFQRLFKRWAGVTPKRFLQFVTIEHAKLLLRDAASVLDTSYEVGLSGPGRLHDLFVSTEAVTPGQYKAFGDGIEVRWGFHDSPFGDCLLAETERGICHLSFADGGGERNLARLRHDWGRSRLVEDRRHTGRTAAGIFGRTTPDKPLPLVLKGTNFQIKVWEALLRVPEGALLTYGDLAQHVCSSRATRAVASAVGANPVSYLIPCHRVLRKTGALGGYAWGTARKRAMLGWEAARTAA